MIDPVEAFPGTVLVIAPHMDDDVLACGGTMAMLSGAGEVHVVYATDGAAAPAPPRGIAPPPGLRALRRDEARDALQDLGIGETNVRFLDLADGRLQSLRQELGRLVADVIAEVAPAHVFVPFRFDRHPDHLALNRVATELVDRDGGDWALLEYFTYHRWQLLPGKDIREHVRPDQRVVVDIEPARRRKRQALDRFASQTTRYFPWQTRPILTPEYLDYACSGPEHFVRYDPCVPGASVFGPNRALIRLVYRLEPVLKAAKDRLVDRWRRRASS